MRSLAPFANLALFGLALAAVDRLLAEYHLGDIGRALGEIPLAATVGALALSLLGYVALVGYDYVGFRILGRPRRFREVLVPSFVSFAVSASAPASMVTGGGVRYKMYSSRGLSAADATALAVVDAISWVLGLLFLAGVALLVRPVPEALVGKWGALSGRSVGTILLSALAAYFVLAARKRRPLRIRGVVLPAPKPRLAWAQLGVSVADWLLTAGSLYVVLGTVEPVNFLDFLLTFFVAQAATLIVPVPGGIGVFEAIVLLLRPGEATGPAVLAALLVYRVAYYLLPLALAGVVVVVQEVRRGEDRGPMARLSRVVSKLAPDVLAGMTFLSGWVLFLSGAIPRGEARLAALARLLPPVLIDASQFLASVVGAALLIVAWGLERRVRIAYQLATFLYGWGILLALTRALDVGIAALLALVLSLLLASGRAFPERPSRLRERLSAGWAFATGSALLVSVWLGLSSHRWAEARGETWWRFTLFGQAPAYVRAMAGAAVAILLLALARTLGRTGPDRSDATDDRGASER
ncbi:MAG: lysylphosphatidylglycerol synthase domain-containing protein [Gemmatimonadales bacterium]